MNIPNFNTSVDIATAGTRGSIVVLLVDESGSMAGVTNDTIGGVNSFVESQFKDTSSGQVVLSVKKFSGGGSAAFGRGYGSAKNEYVLRETTRADGPTLHADNYRPNGGTPLYDVFAETIKEIDTYLRKFNPEVRPAVIIALLTDGEDTTSITYNSQHIKTLVKAAESKEWVFTYLASNVDAFSTGAGMGFNLNNTIQYDISKIDKTFAAMSNVVATTRAAKVGGQSVSDIYSKDMYGATARHGVK